MSDKKRKVPKLRFPGFTDAWEQRKLGEVVFRRNAAEVTGALPGVEYEDVIPEEGRLNKNVSLKEVTKKGLEFLEGDVLFGKLRPYLKNWLFAEFNGVAVGDWWVLYSDKVDGKLIYYLIQTDSYQTVANLSTGTKMPRSDWTTVSQTIFAFPVSADEQLKIGKYFSSIDSLISLHQRKLDNVKMLKKSLLQKLFPKDGEKIPELRFPGFTDDWEQRKLGEVLEERRELRAKSQEYPLVSFTVENGVTPKTERYEREQLVVGNTDEKLYKLTKLDDIVYNPANLKFGAISRNTYRDAVFSPIYVTFEVMPNYRSEYVEYIVTNPNFIRRALRYQQGTVYERMSVSPEDLLSATIYVTSLEEQTVVSRVIRKFDSLISLHQRKLNHLKELKKGLLQQMFV